jgi:hypothetical protein
MGASNKKQDRKDLKNSLQVNIRFICPIPPKKILRASRGKNLIFFISIYTQLNVVFTTFCPSPYHKKLYKTFT